MIHKNKCAQCANQIVWESKKERERRKRWLLCLGWEPKEWKKQICKGPRQFTFEIWQKFRVFSKLNDSTAFWQSHLEIMNAKMYTFPMSFLDLQVPWSMLRKSTAGGHASVWMLLSDPLDGHQSQGEEHSDEPGLWAWDKRESNAWTIPLLVLFWFKKLLMFILSGKSCGQNFW